MILYSYIGIQDILQNSDPELCDPELNVYNSVELTSTKMIEPMSSCFNVQSKRVHALMQEVENERYREKVQKKKKLDALNNE